MLIGKYNCFARLAAKGELLRASPLHKAVAYDLDILQKLAVAETTLVSWVEDVSRSLPQGWPAAGTFFFAFAFAIAFVFACAFAFAFTAFVQHVVSSSPCNTAFVTTCPYTIKTLALSINQLP